MLFSPVKVGPITLSHRVVMPPLTRMGAGADDTVNELMVKYYGQRASRGGLMPTSSRSAARSSPTPTCRNG
jgi:N-ethylmaleimide reductase